MVVMQSRPLVIEELFGSPGRVAILRVLVNAPGPLTGRQVAELAGLTQAGAARALDRLAALGVVARRRVGRAVTHALEPDSALVASIVLPALQGEAALDSAMREDIVAALGPLALSVVLFGSVARGQAEPTSDVDVLQVVPDEASVVPADDVVADWQTGFARRFAKPVSVLIKTPEQLASARSTALVRSILRDGELLTGMPLERFTGTGG
jgi:predicted nucleotidyltransferase/DNA-binding transcriptional ArsR family regulator